MTSSLTEPLARRFASTALSHVARQFPNKLDHVMVREDDAQTPRDLHPVFFGSFDWHSCVHGWWSLLTLKRLYPDMGEAHDIKELADATFTQDKCAAELAYIQRPESRGFERPYGWAWLLYLHLEAERHDSAWAARLEPIARHLADQLKGYLRLLTYPITVGTHANTAFALVLAREWAEQRDAELLALIDQWAIAAFSERQDYRGWEPGGDEFLSPVLIVALLMSKVQPASIYPAWFSALVLDNGWLERSCMPAFVSDRTDGKIAHLDGLNLSRAWCLWEVASVMGQSETAAHLGAVARQHFETALPHVTGDYMGEHWLQSFALLALLGKERSGD